MAWRSWRACSSTRISFAAFTFDVTSHLLNHGSLYGNGRATHSLTLYRAGSGALVFGAFSAFWATLVFLLEQPPHGDCTRNHAFLPRFGTVLKRRGQNFC